MPEGLVLVLLTPCICTILKKWLMYATHEFPISSILTAYREFSEKNNNCLQHLAVFLSTVCYLYYPYTDTYEWKDFQSIGH